MEEIERMQKYLLLIRRAVGWTAEEFGDKIGVTRQTINNLESGRNKLNKTQYIAIRAVLDAEIARSPDDTQMLAALLDMLIDNPDKYDKKSYNDLVSLAQITTPSIISKAATRKDVSKRWIAVAGIAAGAAIGTFSPLVPIVGGTWLARIIHDNKKKK